MTRMLKSLIYDCKVTLVVTGMLDKEVCYLFFDSCNFQNAFKYLFNRCTSSSLSSFKRVMSILSSKSFILTSTAIGFWHC